MRIRRIQPKRKWPQGRRFTAGSVSGVTIKPGSTGGGGGNTRNRPLPVLWYVHDAAYGYRVIGRFYEERKARNWALELNREYEAK